MFAKPSISDLQRAARQLGMNPSEDYLRAIEEITAPIAAAYAALDTMPDELPPVKYPRAPFHRPQGDENRYGGHYYGKAQNIRRRLRAAYDAALASHDLLLLPTTPMKATPIPQQSASPREITRRSWEATRNPCPLNVTGHPAISLPCGLEDGRPIGLMLVGRHYDEATIYRAAAAFERSGDWTRF